MSPQTILPNMNEIRQVVSEELRSQDIDDGRTTQSKTLYPSQLRCVGYNKDKDNKLFMHCFQICSYKYFGLNTADERLLKMYT